VQLAVVRGTLQFVAAPDNRWVLKCLALDLIARSALARDNSKIRFRHAIPSGFVSIPIVSICSIKLN
jgi:hypothetical protein